MIWVEKEGIAVGDIELFFVAQELRPFLRDRRNKTLANGGGESFMFLISLVKFLLGEAIELVDGRSVVVL